MFTPVRVVAAAAILATGGSLVLIAGPMDPAEGPAVPGAAFGPEDVVYVTGTGTYEGDTVACEVAMTDDYVEKRGCGVEYEMAMDDPRLSGRSTATIDRIESMVGTTGTATVAGEIELEGDDGSWVGTYQGVDLPGSGPLRMVAIQTGSGAYEGLTAVTFFDTTGAGSVFELEGVILPTEMLVFPE